MVTIGPLNKTSPATQFYMEANAGASSSSGHNVDIILHAYNGPGGSTASQFNNYGEHAGTVDGYGGQILRASNPFLPSGYANGQQRWDHRGSIWVPHTGAVTVTVRMRITYGSINESHTASLYLPSVATAPSAPGNPTFSELTPTSVRVSWAASASNGGAAIDGYLLRRRSVVNGPYIDVSQVNDRSRVVSGLTPGATYVFSVYAHNSAGYSPQSSQLAVTLPGRAYVGRAGAFPPAAAINVGKAGAFGAAAEVRVGKSGSFVPAN